MPCRSFRPHKTSVCSHFIIYSVQSPFFLLALSYIIRSPFSQATFRNFFKPLLYPYSSSACALGIWWKENEICQNVFVLASLFFSPVFLSFNGTACSYLLLSFFFYVLFFFWEHLFFSDYLLSLCVVYGFRVPSFGVWVFFSFFSFFCQYIFFFSYFF